MPHIEVNHAKIYYELHGEGHPLVLISGFGCDHSFWTSFIEPLSEKFQILIFDNRGSGQTEDNNEAFTIETLADDVIALANALNLKKPHILGHSMGGAIALQIAIKYPVQISKLMVLNAAAKFSAVSSMALRGIIELQKNNVPLDIILDCFMPWVFSNEFLSDPKNVELYKKAVKEYLYPQTVEGNERQLNALDDFDIRASLYKIKNETKIYGNEQDLLVSHKEINFLFGNIKNVALEILQGSHLQVIEKYNTYTLKIINYFV